MTEKAIFILIELLRILINTPYRTKVDAVALDAKINDLKNELEYCKIKRRKEMEKNEIFYQVLCAILWLVIGATIGIALCKFVPAFWVWTNSIKL